MECLKTVHYFENINFFNAVNVLANEGYFLSDKSRIDDRVYKFSRGIEEDGITIDISLARIEVSYDYSNPIKYKVDDLVNRLKSNSEEIVN
ncbi:MAG: hypothetical protein AABW56_04895 [Nanoarchaeota archaeon]